MTFALPIEDDEPIVLATRRVRRDWRIRIKLLPDSDYFSIPIEQLLGTVVDNYKVVAVDDTPASPLDVSDEVQRELICEAL